eukprot:SAG25_NODE_11366_length_306_cov_0.753623_1_plen_65_part_10
MPCVRVDRLVASPRGFPNMPAVGSSVQGAAKQSGAFLAIARPEILSHCTVGLLLLRGRALETWLG